MKCSFSFLSNCKFLFINRMSLNLSALFVHNIKAHNPKKYFYKKWNVEKCLLCKFSLNNFYHFINFDKHVKYPILSLGTCSSTGCVYAIKCILCNHLYTYAKQLEKLKIEIENIYIASLKWEKTFLSL